MVHIEDYCREYGITRQWVFKLIKNGKIDSIKYEGKTFILKESHKARILSAEENRNLLENFKTEIRKKVFKHKHSVIPECLIEIESFQKKYGIKVKGLSIKTLYALASGERNITRKERKDKGTYKINAVVTPRILDLAEHYFFAAAKRNYSLTRDMVLAHARNNEDYWEVASINPDTLYRVIWKEGNSRGWKEAHDYKNSYNNWNQSRARVIGAFTDDTDFGDYISGDDHKMDVHKALNWNELKGSLENKTVYSWFWCEAKTQKILSYVIKTTELKARDLIDSLLEALMYFGKPNKGILIDNGIGDSKEFRSFCDKLNLEIKYGHPYEPTDKATMERLFRYIKDEHDVFFNNFTGSDHKDEGRHPWKSLTPESPDYTFESFKKSLGNYIENFYETRIRNKVIDGKRLKESIRNLFDKYCQTFKFKFYAEEELRYAYMLEDSKPRKFKNYITFRQEQYMPKTYLSPVFNGLKYFIAYNPKKLDTIDLYAEKDIICNVTGLRIRAGQYVMTCHCIRTLTDKMEAVKKYNAERSKAVKQLAASYTDVCLGNNPHLQNSINSQITEKGDIREVRKEVEAKVKTMIEAEIPENKIANVIQETSKDLPELTESDYKNDIMFTSPAPETEDIFRDESEEIFKIINKTEDDI